MTAIAELAATAAQWRASEPAPRSRAAIRRAIARRGTDVRAAISMLLAEPASGMVEVEPPIRGAYRVWTRAAAELAPDAPDEVSPPPVAPPIDWRIVDSLPASAAYCPGPLRTRSRAGAVVLGCARATG